MEYLKFQTYVSADENILYYIKMRHPTQKVSLLGMVLLLFKQQHVFSAQQISICI